MKPGASAEAGGIFPCYPDQDVYYSAARPTVPPCHSVVPTSRALNYQVPTFLQYLTWPEPEVSRSEAVRLIF